MVKFNDASESHIVKQLREDVIALKHVARVSLVRAAVIEQQGDAEVSDLLSREAALMLLVCHGVDSLLDER